MAELVMMKCAATQATLSTAGCARSFVKAQGSAPPAWSSLSHCKFCPVGARNAGVAHDPMAAVTAKVARFCPRCQRPATRFIHGQRCVSCYNRGREAERRLDGRGRVPRFVDAAHSEVVAVAEGAEVQVRVVSQVVSRPEAMLTIARRAKAPMTFGRAPLALDAAMPLAAA